METAVAEDEPTWGAGDGRRVGRREGGDASPLVVLTTETTPAFPTTTVHATRRRGEPGEMQ